MQQQSYQRGVAYIVFAGIFLSFGGLFIRLIESADPWTVLFYRSLTFSLSVCLFMWFRDGRAFTNRFGQIKPLELLVSFSLAIGFIAFVLSIYTTSVANTVLILSTGPVLAAVLAWFCLRERVGPTTWLAILLAIGGVAIMGSGSLTASDKQGIAHAFIAVAAFAIMVVTLRSAPTGKDMLAPTALAGIIAAIMALVFVPTLSISTRDLFLSICLGSVQVGLGFILITLGSRSVPAAQVPLIGLAESALSPIWVWLFVNEIPSVHTLSGGALILLAVGIQGYSGIRQSK